MNTSPSCVAEQRLLFERVERFGQGLRQQRAVGRIGLVVRRTRIARVLDAVEAGDDLRHHEEIRIGGRLADTVLQPRRRIAGRAEHADHHAAVVVAPGGAVGRERVRPEAAIAVDGRRRERRAGAACSSKPADKIAAERRKHLARALGHEQVAPALGIDQRLMQMPAARIVALESRPAHEGREMAHAAADLPGRGAEQQQIVGGGERIAGREGAFDLARAPFVLDRAQRQVDLLRKPPPAR